MRAFLWNIIMNICSKPHNYLVISIIVRTPLNSQKTHKIRAILFICCKFITLGMKYLKKIKIRSKYQ